MKLTIELAELELYNIQFALANVVYGRTLTDAGRLEIERLQALLADAKEVGE